MSDEKPALGTPEPDQWSMPTFIEPLALPEEQALRARVRGRLRLAEVYAVVGGGEDVFALARLFATLDAVREGRTP